MFVRHVVRRRRGIEGVLAVESAGESSQRGAREPGGGGRGDGDGGLERGRRADVARALDGVPLRGTGGAREDEVVDLVLGDVEEGDAEADAEADDARDEELRGRVGGCLLYTSDAADE